MINERLSKYPSLWPTALHSPHGPHGFHKHQGSGDWCWTQRAHRPRRFRRTASSRLPPGGNGGEADSICMIIANWVIIYHYHLLREPGHYMGVSLNGGFSPQFKTTPSLMIIFWKRKIHGFVGETHHFRVHPQMDSRCFLFKRHFLLEEKHGKKAWFKAWKLMFLMF